MDWLERLNQIKSEGGSCVLVSIVLVRGHAPREAGAKMVVSSSDPSSDPSSNMFSSVSGSVGGGNLEQMCIVKARGMLERGGPKTELLTVPLTLKNTGQYGVQCCGGEVTLTLEYLNFSKPQVAIFGAGHVGLALARVLSTLPIEILLVEPAQTRLERRYPDPRPRRGFGDSRAVPSSPGFGLHRFDWLEREVDSLL
mgnify:CR=1 FL=1